MLLLASRLLSIIEMVFSEKVIKWKESFLYRWPFSYILANYTASCTILEIHHFKSRNICHRNIADGLRLIAIVIVRFLKYDRKICFYLKKNFLSEKRLRWPSCCRLRKKWYYLLNFAFFLALKVFFPKIRNVLVFEKYKEKLREKRYFRIFNAFLHLKSVFSEVGIAWQLFP